MHHLMSVDVIPEAGPSNQSNHNRWYHVDKVLERPGPSTDPGFVAGDEVTAERIILLY